jgi:MFS transporter, PPP family, 3-phenylpropionic acid transporter
MREYSIGGVVFQASLLLIWYAHMRQQRMPAAGILNYFLLFITFGILGPYLQLYLKVRGFSPARIGILLGCLECSGFIGPIVLGRLADRHSAYRGLLSAGLVVTLTTFIFLEFSNSFSIYIVGMIIMGFAYRATIPLLDSLIGKILPDPMHQYGRLRVAGSIGFVFISIVLGLTTLSTGNSSLGIIVVFGVSALLAALAVGFLPHVPGHGDPARRAAPQELGGNPRSIPAGPLSPAFWVVMCIVFLGRFGIGAYYSFFSLYLQHSFPGTAVSLLWAIGALAEIPTIFLSGTLIRRFGFAFMFSLSLAAISVRLALFTVAASVPVLALAQLLHAFTFGSFHSTAVAYINSTISPERRGVGMAIYTAFGVGLPSFLAGIIGGFIIEANGFPALFLSYAVVPLPGIIALVAFRARLFPQAAVRS